MEAPEKWSFQFQNEETVQFKHEELFASDALLLGKVTYQIFANSWPARQGDFADRMNNLPKYVVSTGLNQFPWNNSHPIQDHVVEEISTLKRQPGQDILVAGSGGLVQTLMQRDLVDEYRFLIHPIVLGNGKRFYQDGCPATLRLMQTQLFDTGMVLLRYQPQRK
ncbi:MAG TPA: dihydrofolate reductase family protein [Anaerolineales bacterium]|nr:dihydrofolate reductase family protein [Anaerolineales bacterium]